MSKMPLNAAGAVGKDSRHVKRAVAIWVGEGACNSPRLGIVDGSC